MYENIIKIATYHRPPSLFPSFLYLLHRMKMPHSMVCQISIYSTDRKLKCQLQPQIITDGKWATYTLNGRLISNWLVQDSIAKQQSFKNNLCIKLLKEKQQPQWQKKRYAWHHSVEVHKPLFQHFFRTFTNDDHDKYII